MEYLLYVIYRAVAVFTRYQVLYASDREISDVDYDLLLTMMGTGVVDA